MIRATGSVPCLWNEFADLGTRVVETTLDGAIPGKALRDVRLLARQS
jgi:hypothetical protein